MDRIQFYIDQTTNRIKFYIDQTAKRVSFYLDHFIDIFSVFAIHFWKLCDSVCGQVLYVLSSFSCDAAYGFVKFALDAYMKLLSADVADDILQARNELLGRIEDCLHEDDMLFIECWFDRTASHTDYSVGSVKLQYTYDRVLDQYTFTIGQDDMLLYDWLYIDI